MNKEIRYTTYDDSEGDICMSDLARKRKKSCFAVIGATLGTGLTSATPTPSIEVPKQLTLEAADIALCFAIYQIYFGDEVKLTGEKLADLLVEAGIVTVVAGLFAYAGVKATQGVCDEFANCVGPTGWLVSGGLTASETFVIGSLWWFFCDRRYRNNRQLIGD